MTSRRRSPIMATVDNSKYLLIVFVTCVVLGAASVPQSMEEPSAGAPSPRPRGLGELGSVFCYCDYDRRVGSKALVT